MTFSSRANRSNGLIGTVNQPGGGPDDDNFAGPADDLDRVAERVRHPGRFKGYVDTTRGKPAAGRR